MLTKSKNVDELFNKFQEFTAAKNENSLKLTFDKIQDLQQLVQYQDVVFNEMHKQSFDESVVEFDDENAAFSEISISISSTSITIFISNISLFMKFSFRRSSVFVIENTSEFLFYKQSFDVTVFKFIFAMSL